MSATIEKKPIYRSLYFQVIVAIILGVLLGYFFPSSTKIVDGAKEHIPGLGEQMYPLGKGFIKLIKMVIAPIIFCTVVSGIAGMEDMKSVGKTGGYALLYFEIVSTIALIIGLVIVNVVAPGAGFGATKEDLDASVVKQFGGGEQQSTIDFILNIIPNTVVGAFAEGEILQVLFFAILFGFALHRMGQHGKPLLAFIDQFCHAMFNVVNIVMKVAPIGAFGAMAFTIGKFGLASLLPLLKLMVCFYATCLIFIFGVLGLIARYCGISILKLIKFIGAELLIVLGTSSSESVLPRLLKKMELAGCAKSTVGLVVPTGYSFNLDGTSIYLTMAAIFIAQALGVDLSLKEEIFLLLILMLSSKGAAAVTGGGFIVLVATLTAVGTINPAGVSLILGIDRFMSEARALTNLVGNTLATIVVAKFSGTLDEQQLHYALNNRQEINKQVEDA